jgi:hypothetical protein
MSPQLLWTIAGLILTVLTLGGVGISAFQATDASSAKLIAAETGNIVTASRLYLANAGGTTATGISAQVVQPYILDLVLTGTGATSTMTSKAVGAVTYKVAVNATTTKFDVTITGVTAALQPAVTTALTSKACTSALAANVYTYTCNG